MTFAKLWTASTLQAPRGNIENYDGTSSGGRNYIDPLALSAEMRDPFPKADLAGGYLGDGYPLCASLVGTQPFLAAGARFSYHRTWSSSPTLVLDADSELRAALCGGSSGGGGSCRPQSMVVLERKLTCTGTECDVDTVRVVSLTAGGATHHFEWQRPSSARRALSSLSTPTLRSSP